MSIFFIFTHLFNCLFYLCYLSFLLLIQGIKDILIKKITLFSRLLICMQHVQKWFIFLKGGSNLESTLSLKIFSLLFPIKIGLAFILKKSSKYFLITHNFFIFNKDSLYLRTKKKKKETKSLFTFSLNLIFFLKSLKITID